MCKRKDDYWHTEDGLLLLRGWATDGLTDKQIAEDKIGIHVATLYKWKQKFSDINDALKDGKEIPDRKVENALYMMATGYEREEVVIDTKGKEHTIKKWYPPNTTAIIYWLKNRKPEQWRDKREEQVTEQGNGSGLIMMPERTDEEQ